MKPLAKTTREWKRSFEKMREKALRVRIELDHALRSSRSCELHDDAIARLRDVLADGSLAIAAVEELRDHVEGLRDELDAARRYSAQGLRALVTEVEAAMAEDAVGAGRRWLLALLDASDAGEFEAARAIAAADLPWNDGLRPGAECLGRAFAGWTDAKQTPDVVPVDAFADGRVPGWQDVLTHHLRARVHRFAAWIALHTKGARSNAGYHVEEAVKLFPYDGRMHAARAGYHLFFADFDRAATDAQHAIEIAPQDPSGYLAMGTWAELTGKFSGSDDLYRRGFERMPSVAIEHVHRRTALVDPPGRLLKNAAAELLARDRPETARELAEEALLSGVRGLEAHPEAEVHAVLSRALEALPSPDRRGAAQAAVDAGRLFIWNGDVESAIMNLRRGIDLGESREAGWFLADALLAKSYPLGAPTPDRVMVGEARERWEAWKGQVGAPEGRTSWGYLTRAIISDLETQQLDCDRREGIFRSLLYVEKALIHDDTDAQRWGYAAEFLRYAGLEELAFEAVEVGYHLSAADRQVLAERLPLLANRARFEEAETAARQLIAMYGDDPWSSAVQAWVALHQRDYARTLELLALPLAEGNDRSWYFEMEAQAELGLHQVDNALAAYRKVMQVPPVDGHTKCRMAVASLALGNRREAAHWAAEAEADPTRPRGMCIVAAGLIALADNDIASAARLLHHAVTTAKSAVEVDDLVEKTLLSMRALHTEREWRVAVEERLRAATSEVVAVRKAWLGDHPPSADGELAEALGAAHRRAGAGDCEQIALTAVAARRHAAAGHPDEAKAKYEQLIGTDFEPEATKVLASDTPLARRWGAARVTHSAEPRMGMP